MTTSSPNMRAAEWGLLLLLSVLWGGSFFFFKIMVGAWPPLTVVFARVALAALVLNLVLALLSTHLGRFSAHWPAFAVMGLINNVVPFTLIVFGETRITSGLAAILNATTPLFTVLVAHFATRDERLTPRKGFGVAIGFVGVLLLVGPGVLSDALAGAGTLGEVACLAAAFSYACAGIFGRRFRGTPPLAVATGQISASSLMLLPMVAAIDQPWLLPLPGPEVWGATAGIAVLCTALAYLLYFEILARAGATNLLLVTFLIPISALLLGWSVLAEDIPSRAFVGMALIGAGLAFIDGRIGGVIARHARPN